MDAFVNACSNANEYWLILARNSKSYTMSASILAFSPFRKTLACIDQEEGEGEIEDAQRIAKSLHSRPVQCLIRLTSVATNSASLAAVAKSLITTGSPRTWEV
jgi:hypothetical protein